MYQTTYENDSPDVFHATFRRNGRKWFGWLYMNGRKVWGCDDWSSKREARHEIDNRAKSWRCVPARHRRVT